MPDVELLATGEGDYRLHDPDALRAWMRDRRRRDFVDETTTAAEAVRRLVADGDYVSFDFSSFTRGPLVLIREIVRQRRQNLWDEGSGIEAVSVEMGVKPRVAAHVERLARPSARELGILRDEIDPTRSTIGSMARS
jgi:hypothetical protein